MNVAKAAKRIYGFMTLKAARMLGTVPALPSTTWALAALGPAPEHTLRAIAAPAIAGTARR